MAPVTPRRCGGAARARVCPVGGGFTGLWTALAIKRLDPAQRWCSSSATSAVRGQLDTLRSEQKRLRGHVAAELDELHALGAKFLTEDQVWQQELRATFGRSEAPPADVRHPSSLRPHSRPSKNACGPQPKVLADHADEVIATVRARRRRCSACCAWSVKARARSAAQAENLLAEARAEEFRLHRMGIWLRQTSDDHALGRQPAPVSVPMPDNFQMRRTRSKGRGTTCGTGPGRARWTSSSMTVRRP